MDSYVREIRHACRRLVADRHLLVPAVLCLALGIGINSTIFSVSDGLLVRHLPFEEPDRLVLLGEVQRTQRREESARASYPNFDDWRRQSRSFTAIGGVSLRSVTVADQGEPERHAGALVTSNLFPILGVRPALGAGFREDHDRPNAERVVMISDDLWRTRYHADPSVIGRSIRVDGRPHLIVGVMPARFRFPFNQDVWVPLVPVLNGTERFAREIFGVARLAPGATLDQARTDIGGITSRLQTQYPEANRGWEASVRPFREWYAPPQTRILVVFLIGAAWCVLLIACANVANLMVVRATARQHEVALQRALGATGRRITRQLLTECLLLSLISLPLGIIVAVIGLRLFERTLATVASAIPYVFQWEFSERVAIYTLGAAVVAALVFGGAPALQVLRGRRTLEFINDSSKGAGAGSRRHWLRSTLVVGQLAASLAALIGASFFVRGFFDMNQDDRGVDVARVMTLRFALPGDTYETPDRVNQRVEDIVRRVEELSGVEAAAVSGVMPFEGGAMTDALRLPGRTFDPGEEPPVTYAGVTAHFLQALGVPLRQGRNFTDAETGSRAHVAIINESMAARLWPSGGAVGQQFAFVTGPDREPFTVIGVAGNLPNDGPTDEPVPVPSAYIPYPHVSGRTAGLLIRVSGNPAGAAGLVRDALRKADPDIVPFSVRTLTQVRSEAAFPFRILASVFGALGGIGLLLAAVGLYGVLASAVSQRRHEIGVRLALGARASDVTRMMVWQGAKLCAIGIVFGLATGFLVTSLLGSGFSALVNPYDPLSVIAATIVLAAVGLLASYVPARHATRVDPAQTLRSA